MKFLRFLLILFLGVALAITFKWWQVKKHSLEFVPESVVLSPNAPLQSLTAAMSEASGTVEVMKRDGVDYTPVGVGETIRQGESIKTESGSGATVVFDQLMSMKMEEISVVNLINTNKMAMLVNQAGGTVGYVTSDVSIPGAVKVLHLLVEMTGAEASVAIDAQTITVGVKSGKVKAAFETKTNVTQIIEIPPGKKMIYDDASRTFRLKKL
jgi:hypothetical protein